jgi:acetyl esterase/lipase
MSPRVGRRSLMFGAASAFVNRLHAADREEYAVEMKTLAFAKRGGADLLLDIYLPLGAPGRVPTILFLHGGGWSGGTRTTGPDFKRFFARDGFATASIEYRLTPSICFPSNAEDVKTAIRWLRANVDVHGLSPRFGIWGTSAGGHLAAIAGLTPRGVFEVDGGSGGGSAGNPDQPSGVDCVLDAYGPSSLLVMDAQTDQENPTLQPIASALGAGGAPDRPRWRATMRRHRPNPVSSERRFRRCRISRAHPARSRMCAPEHRRFC